MKYEEWIEIANLPGQQSSFREGICYTAGQHDLLKQVQKLVDDSTRLDSIIPCLMRYLETGDVYGIEKS